MAFHFNSYSITLLMSGMAALFVSVLLFQIRQSAVKWFGVTMLCNALWAISYAFELSVLELPQMLFWINFEYIGISFAPAAYFMFIVKFIGRDEWLSKWNRIILFAFSFIALFFVWTNRWHRLHYSSVAMDNSGPFPLLDFTPGLWYYVHTVYFYFMLSLGAFLLVSKFWRADNFYKKQNLAILIGTFIPWAANFSYLLGYRPHNHIDLTPYAFILSSIIIGFGLMRLQLFNLVPIARSKVIESMQEGILVLDPQMRITDLNGMMREMLAYSSKRLIGATLGDVLAGQESLMRLVVQQTDGQQEIAVGGNSGRLTLMVTVTQLFTGKNIFRGTLLLFANITEVKMAAEKLKEQADELRVLNQLKDRVFSIISHDLRSPLATLQGLLGILGQGYLSEAEFKSMIPTLSNDLGYTSHLLDNLLHWSKSQLKGESILQEHFDLGVKIEKELQMAGKRAAEKGIIIENRVLENHVHLYADKNMTALVLRNLIGNAIKFCKAGNVIRIEATDGGTDKALISISDNGCGITPESISKIFGPTTFSTIGTSGEKGTGIGLKVCKDFVEKNGGRLWVESSADNGSTFYFTLQQTNKTNIRHPSKLLYQPKGYTMFL